MPAAFVHGNPETADIWQLLIPMLDRDDIVTLSPPGFGAPTPAGWGATRAEYIDWLVGEVEAFDEPVDLVGHDWGGGHVVGMVLARPDLVHTWCIDVGGLFHPDYEWNEMAKAWQTPEIGEAAIASMTEISDAEKAAMFTGLGMTEEIATAVAAGADAEMGRCILALYRDAAQPRMVEVGAEVAKLAARPGHVLIAADDGYVGTEAMARDTASRAGAGVTVLSDVGHWWMIQDPAAGAAALNSFWAANS